MLILSALMYVLQCCGNLPSFIPWRKFRRKAADGSCKQLNISGELQGLHPDVPLWISLDLSRYWGIQLILWAEFPATSPGACVEFGKAVCSIEGRIYRKLEAKTQSFLFPTWEQPKPGMIQPFVYVCMYAGTCTLAQTLQNLIIKLQAGCKPQIWYVITCLKKSL